MIRANRRNFISSLATGVAALGMNGNGAAGSGKDAPAQATRKTSKQNPTSPAAPSVDLGPAGIAKKFWIDPKIAALPSGRWRKIWLDFHNSQYIPSIGEKFNAD